MWGFAQLILDKGNDSEVISYPQNNQVVTSSRYVARNFAREQRSVLRDIDNLIQDGGAQDCADLFYETDYIHEQNKKEYREYLMNRDGFTLLMHQNPILDFDLKFFCCFLPNLSMTPQVRAFFE